MELRIYNWSVIPKKTKDDSEDWVVCLETSEELIQTRHCVSDCLFPELMDDLINCKYEFTERDSELLMEIMDDYDLNFFDAVDSLASIKFLIRVKDKNGEYIPDDIESFMDDNGETEPYLGKVVTEDQTTDVIVVGCVDGKCIVLPVTDLTYYNDEGDARICPPFNKIIVESRYIKKNKN